MKLKYLALALFFISASAQSGVDSDFDFEFQVNGDRDLRPLQVFTNGNKTYFQFRDPQNPPLLFSKGRIIRPTIEEPYTVVSSLDEATTIVGKDGRDKAEVKYLGRYTPTKFVTPTANTIVGKVDNKTPVVTPAEKAPEIKAAIPEPMPKTTMANVAPVKKDPAQVITAKVMPTVSADTKPSVAVTQVQPVPKPVIYKFTGEFKFNPAKPAEVVEKDVAKASAKDLLEEPKVVPAPIIKPEAKIPSEIFISSEELISDAQLEMLVAHVSAGGKILLEGKSSVANPKSRVSWSNARAKKSKQDLVTFGIPESAIQVQILNKYPNTKDVTGVAITLTKGS